MTALQLVESAMRLIGVLASGESAPSNDANDALSSANDLIDSWSTEKLLIPNETVEQFTLIANQQTYKFGTGGDFNSARPLRVDRAGIIPLGSAPNLEIPMDMLNVDQWADILLKSIVSPFPLYLYSDGAYPFNNINVWPIPSQADTIVMYTWKQLSELSSLTTTLSLPPGYQRALRYNLAVDLAPEYGRPCPPEVAAVATESKAAIKRVNTKPLLLHVDDALKPKPAVWNWYTGDPT